MSHWRREYRFESRWLERGGIRLHYLDEGAGAPVVMVHGNPTWSFYFRRLVEGLRGTHRCVVPDHVGCGLSEKPGEDRYGYRLADRIGDLTGLLEHLGVRERVTLVVHDWGGMIGMGWAVRHVEAVERIVVLNTAAFLLPLGKALPWQLRLVHRRNAFSSLCVRGLNLFCRGAARKGSARGLSEEARAGLLAPYDSWENRLAVLRFVQDIPLDPSHPSYATARGVEDRLHLLRDKPMLICWGMRDFVFDADFLGEWRRRFPGAEVHEFADGGHYVMEDAWERIVPMVKGFAGGATG